MEEMMRRTRLAAVRFLSVWLLVACAAAACRNAPPAPGDASGAPSSAASANAPALERGSARTSGSTAAPRRDLESDERCGGHTLSRHVGWTDEQLAQRLRQQRDIAAASTYTDRDTAEAAIGAGLAADAERIGRWTARHGRRPNIVVRYRAPADRPVGRSLVRGASAAVPCYDALIVLRWRGDLDDFCVLTSYPEVRR
jgi:hypothetical protein